MCLYAYFVSNTIPSVEDSATNKNKFKKQKYFFMQLFSGERFIFILKNMVSYIVIDVKEKR